MGLTMKQIVIIVSLITMCLCSCVLPADAQYNLSETLAQKFDTYRSRYLPEKIYIHTDRTFYVTGDYLWLKVVTVDGVDHRPFSLDRVAYVEILDAANTPVVQAKIALDKGTGHTALFLPATLSSGNYTLRAYTRWMRNFPADAYFSKQITIVNTFRPLASVDEASVPAVDIQFFPEGGNFIAGLKSKVGFRMVDKTGMGIARDGYVVNQVNDTVAIFETLRFGLGNFSFTPKAGDTYRAFVRDYAGNFIEQPMPAYDAQGFVMTVNEVAGKLRVAVSSVGEDSQDIYLLVHTRGKRKELLTKRLTEGKATFEFEKEKLDAGVSQITLFDGQLNPRAERLYFTPPIEKLTLDIKLNAMRYAQRRKCILDIDAKNSGGPMMADMSVSVYRIDSLQTEDPVSIENYLELTSDLSGNVESPNYYFSDDTNVKAAADNLMLTHGWRRFTWHDILKNDSAAVGFFPEYRSQMISASLQNSETDEPTANIPAYLSAPGKSYNFRGAKSNREGKLFFEMDHFYGEGKIIIQTNSAVDSIYRIRLESPFSDDFAKQKQAPLLLTPASRGELTQRSLNMQMQNAYYEDEIATRTVTTAVDKPFYGEPDSHYRLDDYTRFSVMEDVMREYVPLVFVRKKKKDFYFIVVNKLTNDLLKPGPLLLLDGVPIFNTNKIMEVDPLKIETLDVVARRYFYGALSFDGIVDYKTYGKESYEFPIAANALVADYNGLEYQREFFTPMYETSEQRNSRLPDSRDLMYWAPVVKTNKEGKAHLIFYTSDQLGTYVINIQGITPDGTVGSTSHTFEVYDEAN